MNATALTVIETIGKTLHAPDMKAQITRLLPKDVSYDAFTETAIIALQTKPELVECDRGTLYTAILRCAKDGLLPDGRQAAIVPFNTRVGNTDNWVKRAQAMPMVEGVIYLFAKSGVQAYAVSIYQHDKVRLWNDDLGQHFEHEPMTFGERGERLGAVAVGRDKAGRTWVEAMNMKDLEAAKKATKQKDKQGNLTGPWKETPDRMEQKSALHRLGKRIPNIQIRDDDEFMPSDVVATVAQAAPDSPAAAPQAAAAPAAPARPKALQKVIDAGAQEEAATTSEAHQEPEDDSQAEIF